MVVEWHEQPVEIQTLRTYISSNGGDLQIIESDGKSNQVMRGSLGTLRLEVLADRARWFFSVGREGEECFDFTYWLTCAGWIEDDAGYLGLDKSVNLLQRFLAEDMIRHVDTECVRNRRDAFVKYLQRFEK